MADDVDDVDDGDVSRFVEDDPDTFLIIIAPDDEDE